RSKSEADARAKEARERLTKLKILREQQQKDAERLDAESRALGKHGVDLAEMKDDIDATDRIVKALTTQIQALDVESAAPCRVRLIEDAQIVKPDPLKRQILAAGIGGGGIFVLSLLGLCFCDRHRLFPPALGQVEPVQHAMDEGGEEDA